MSLGGMRFTEYSNQESYNCVLSRFPFKAKFSLQRSISIVTERNLTKVLMPDV